MMTDQSAGVVYSLEPSISGSGMYTDDAQSSRLAEAFHHDANSKVQDWGAASTSG